MPKLLIPIAAALAVAGATAGGATYLLTRDDAVEEAPPAVQASPEPSPAAATPTPTGEPVDGQTQLWRWLNVTVEVPKDSGIVVTRGFGPFLGIASEEDRGSGIGIDALTGVVVKDTTKPENRDKLESILATLRVSPLDQADLPWPYTGDAPGTPPERIGDLTFIRPTPDAGIVILEGHGDGPNASTHYIQIKNGRSRVFVYVDTGIVRWEPDFPIPEDRDMLERFLSGVRFKDTPVTDLAP
jgi:hypothetical protein